MVFELFKNMEEPIMKFNDPVICGTHSFSSKELDKFSQLAHKAVSSFAPGEVDRIEIRPKGGDCLLIIIDHGDGTGTLIIACPSSEA